ncbi:MAG: DUF3821 domain-containing protein [Methanomicrobiales archaeon]|nr:DUF3821 domain-containing protein [Methanomicrobiales archaeon]
MALDSKIPREGTVFVGENDIDISECNVRTGDEIAFWSSGFPEGTPDSRAKVMDARHFFVDPAYFSGKTGTWYGLVSKKPVFKVEDPWVKLEVIENGIDHDPDWIKKGNLISFKISTNMFTISDRAGSAGAPIKISLTGPNETEYNQLISPTGKYNLENIYVYYSPFDTGAIWETRDETEYPEGEYVAWATCNVNSIHEKNPGEGITTSSKTTFTLSKVKPDEDSKKETSDEESESMEKDSEPTPTPTPEPTPEPTEEVVPVLTLDVTPDITSSLQDVTPNPTKPPLASPPKSTSKATQKQPLSITICIIALVTCFILADRKNS